VDQTKLLAGKIVDYSYNFDVAESKYDKQIAHSKLCFKEEGLNSKTRFLEKEQCIEFLFNGQ
jgi:hypothetical protein